MSILFCTGTLFSKWQDVVTTIKSSNPSIYSDNTDLCALANEICQQKYPELDELSRKPFSLAPNHQEDARQLIRSKLIESGFICSENNICLNLDFWKDAIDDARFLLFLSSPESELINYINVHSFDALQIEKVMTAWVIRTQAMLTFFMNNRDKGILVSVEACDTDHEAFRRQLKALTELDLTITPRPKSVQDKPSVLIEYLATSLLTSNRHVSDLYDEARSASTLITDEDKSIPGIKERNSALIPAFLDEICSNEQLVDAQSKLNDELSLSHIQINQMREELDYYFNKSIEQEGMCIQQTENLANVESENLNLKTSNEAMIQYLSNDPLLKIAGRVRPTR